MLHVEVLAYSRSSRGGGRPRGWHGPAGAGRGVSGARPIEVVVGVQVVEIGGLKQRALLGALLLRLGTVVRVDVLVDDLWGESALPAVGARFRASPPECGGFSGIMLAAS